MIFFDTHCHLNFKPFKDDWRDVIDRAFDNNTWMINFGVDEETSQRAVEIAENYQDGVYASAGFHPIYIKDKNEKVEDIINENFYSKIVKNLKVVAIGEIGLDYYHTKDENLKELQKKVLRRQIEIAKKFSKPIILHSREATDNLMEIVKEFLPLNAVIHCFSESGETAKKYLDMGLLISFTGIITFTDKYDETIKNIPLDKIMIETDAPYLAPVPHRGERNEPLFVKYVAQKIADIKKISLEEVAEQTTKNAREFFGI